jgi:SP family sugar porter-like MFS transporter
MKSPVTLYDKYYLFRITLTSAFGGLLFGYDWVVIGGAKPFYEQFFNIANIPGIQGWAMSCALIGCIFGAMLSGGLSDRFGRKKLLILSAILFFFASIGTGFASQFTVFVLFRMLGGVGIGLASNLSPMYIAEVSPKEVRGRYVSLNQLTIVIGILAAQIINWLIADPVPLGATDASILASWNGQIGWRWMFWACTVPSFMFLTLMFLVPESPRWLAKRGKRDAAQRILSRIGGEEYSIKELRSIEKTLSDDTEKVNFRNLVQPGMGKVLIIGIVLAVFQQWCGINVIFNYAQEVFAQAGYGVSDILFNIVVTGSVNLLFTFVAITMVDKLGRRPLMLLGSGGLAVIFSIVGLLYFFKFQGLPLLILVVLAIACYSMSLAPITWVVLSEIFPNRIRGAAMSIATLALWIACFILTYSFPLLNHSLKASGTFWLYASISIAGFIFIKTYLPETKGKSLEQIESDVLKKSPLNETAIEQSKQV